MYMYSITVIDTDTHKDTVCFNITNTMIIHADREEYSNNDRERNNY